MMKTKAGLVLALLVIPAAGVLAQSEVPGIPEGEVLGMSEAEPQMEVLWTVSPEACRKYAEHLKDGDLIFQEGRFILFKKIAEASNSWVSHVGVVFNEAGEWVVYESKVTPGSRTPLCKFLGRSGRGHTAIGRLKGRASGDFLNRVRIWASDPANRDVPYDLGFDYTRKGKSFCSKFVSNAYEAAGRRLGRPQTLKELFDEFRGTPERRRSLVNFFKLVLVRAELPWERVTLTPASVMEDSGLSVSETYVEGAPAS